MLYLLDANTLIDANRDYYPIGRVDEYWTWLVHQGQQGRMKIPLEILEEIKGGKKDELAHWAKETATDSALRFDEEVDVKLVQQVMEHGYAPDLTDIEIEQIGRDPFLIAYALADAGLRCVVTTERSKPKKLRANRKIPDVCEQFGIPVCDGFELSRALDFRTNWNTHQPSETRA